MSEQGGGNSFRLTSVPDTFTGHVLSAEVDAVNANFSLVQPFDIRTEDCGEANALYDPETVEIVFCREFEAHLTRLAEMLN